MTSTALAPLRPAVWGNRAAARAPEAPFARLPALAALDAWTLVADRTLARRWPSFLLAAQPAVKHCKQTALCTVLLHAACEEYTLPFRPQPTDSLTLASGPGYPPGTTALARPPCLYMSLRVSTRPLPSHTAAAIFPPAVGLSPAARLQLLTLPTSSWLAAPSFQAKQATVHHAVPSAAVLGDVAATPCTAIPDAVIRAMSAPFPSRLGSATHLGCR